MNILGLPAMREQKHRTLIQEHHQKTGCGGEIKPYKESENVHGFFCTCCKKEWISGNLHVNPPPSEDHRPVAHHVVPSFCCLQTSDTGNFVNWKYVKGSPRGLEPGDHVAWLRIFSYWHHAIVDEVNEDSIKVIEWSSGRCSTHIHERTMKYDLLAKFGCSFMYKAYYPKHVLDLNPPELVLLRARARLDDTGYGPLSDNCEHFATFCKTGQHRCNQLHQLKVTMRAWLRRILVSFLHIAIVVSFAETIEMFTVTGKDWIGAVLLIATEILYLISYFCIVYSHDTRRQEFRKQKAQCTRACRCASLKAVLQSATIVTFSALSSVYLVRAIRGNEDWSEGKETGAQIGFGVLGGMVGNVVGFILFALIPYPCCRNEIQDEDGLMQDVAAADNRN